MGQADRAVSPAAPLYELHFGICHQESSSGVVLELLSEVQALPHLGDPFFTKVCHSVHEMGPHFVQE